MKPKILIDAIALLSPLTGIGRYSYEVSKFIQKEQNIQTNFFYGYTSKELIKPSDKPAIKSLKSQLIRIPLLKKLSRQLIVIITKFTSSTYDLYWQPNFIPYQGIKAKKIITSVHDFSFLLNADFHPKERIEYFQKNFFKNITRSDLIITGSEFSKLEIIDRLEIEPSKVKVIYHGIDHQHFKILDDLSIQFNLPRKFIFSVGSIEPRKNLLGLLKAYEFLDSNIKSEYKLVLAGFKGWENKEIMKLIELNKEHIHYLGFISDEELVKIYNLASLFAYPSFYEGFGLPVLEAMACGTPVVCSDHSSLPEVGGDAVLYCNPNSVEDIKEKIELVLKDNTLQKNMIQKGLQRASTFTWKKSAQEHMQLFESLLK